MENINKLIHYYLKILEKNILILKEKFEIISLT